MEQKNTDIVKSVSLERLFVLYKKYFIYIRPDVLRNAVNIIIICGITVSGAFIIWMVGGGLDALNNNEFDVVPSYLAVFILLVIFLQILRYINIYIYEWTQQRIIYDIRRELYSHILTLAIPFKNKYATGDLLTRLGQDIVHISELLVLTPAHTIHFTLTIVLYLGILLYIDVWLTLLVLVFVPILFFHQRLFLKRTRVAARKFLHYQGNMSAFEEESLCNIQGIITFSAEPTMLQHFDAVFSKFRRAAMRNLLLNNMFVVTFELLVAVAAIILVIAGVYRINQGLLSIGSLINFLLYLGYLSVPLRGLARIPVESQIRACAAERVAEILDELPAITDTDNAVMLDKVQGKICFKDVDFAYPGRNSVVKIFNLKINEREFVALMGASGAGKSTLARLLLRIYEADSGKILINGIDIRELKLHSLRSHIAVVWQEPFLIDDTVFENLRLCKPDASEQQMRSALRDAHAHDFIEQLPHGYETNLGINGSRLSTGQRQRIAIAQALLRQAEIYIFDEATSALDSNTELAVQEVFDKLRVHSTVIVIAHRMSTIMNADRIIYLNSDGTATVGTHLELQKRHEPFRQVVAHQNSGVRGV